MKLTVITICYNNKQVEDTCKSVVNQSFQDFEWIVVDGGSTDGTLDILNQYKDRINVFISEKDSGVYNAMNKGIAASNGEYLQFLNGGDYFNNENVLKNIIGELDGTDLVYGDLKILSDEPFIKKYPDKLPQNYFIYESLPHPATFIKKDLFDKFGKYKEDYKIVSDWEKWIIFIKENNCSYKHISEIIADYGLDGISAVLDDTHKRERAEVIKKYYDVDINQDAIKKYAKIFGFPLIKIKKTYDKTKIYLLGLQVLVKKHF